MKSQRFIQSDRYKNHETDPQFFVQRLYSFYVSRSATILPCEKPMFSLRETYGFHTENIKHTKPKCHYLQQAFQILSDKKSPEVQKHTSGDFSQDKLYSLNFFLQIQREFRHSPILGTYKCRSLYCQFMRFAYGLPFQNRATKVAVNESPAPTVSATFTFGVSTNDTLPGVKT